MIKVLIHRAHFRVWRSHSCVPVLQRDSFLKRMQIFHVEEVLDKLCYAYGWTPHLFFFLFLIPPLSSQIPTLLFQISVFHSIYILVSLVYLFSRERHHVVSLINISSRQIMFCVRLTPSSQKPCQCLPTYGRYDTVYLLGRYKFHQRKIN